MRQRIDPAFEYDPGPVLWGAVVVFGLGLVVNFVLGRPLWLVLVALVGGGVAASRCGFYDVSANNGALAVVVGTLALLPFLSFRRTTWFPIEGTGDTLFYVVVFVLSWLPMVVIVLAPIGYVAGIVVDNLRRRLDSPLGY